jgi:transposase
LQVTEIKKEKIMMLTARTTKVFIYRNFVDMRKGHNGLSYLVSYEMKLDLLSGAIFLFTGRNRKSAKALLWDGTGLVLVHKKLESGKFMSFKNLQEVEEISSNELSLIMEGTKINLPLSKSQLKIKLE